MLIYANAIRVALLSILLMPLIVLSSSIYPFVVDKVFFSWIVIDITLIAWALFILRVPQYRPKLSWVLVILCLWMAVLSITSFTGVNVTKSLWSNYERMDGLVNWVHWFFYIVMLISMLRTDFQWKSLLMLNLIICTVVVLWGMFNSGDGALTSTIGNGLYLGHYIVISIGFALAVIHLIKSPIIYYLMHIAISVNLIGLWYTGARSAFVVIIAILLGYLIVLLFVDRNNIARKVAALIATVLVAVAAILLISNSYGTTHSSERTITKISSTFNNDESTAGRYDANTAAIHGILNKPTFGWGLSNYDIVWLTHSSNSAHGKLMDNSHNVYLQHMVHSGIVGGVIYIGLFIIMLWICYKCCRKRDKQQQLFILGLLGGVIGYIISNMFMVDSPVHYMLFAILVAVVAYIGNEYIYAIPESLQKIKNIFAYSTLTSFIILSIVFLVATYTIAKSSTGYNALGEVMRNMENNPYMEDWYKGVIGNSIYSNVSNIEDFKPYHELIQELDDRNNIIWRYYITRTYIKVSETDHQYKDMAAKYVSEFKEKAPDSAYSESLENSLNN